jgi:hypothetical protein
MEVEDADKDADNKDEVEETTVNKMLSLNPISLKHQKTLKQQMKNTLCLPQKPVTILLLKQWPPQASLKTATLQVGQLSPKWTRRLLVNPETIRKHLQPKTFAEFAKETLLSTSMCAPLAKNDTNLHQRFCFPRWKNKNATRAIIHTTSDVRDFVSHGKVKKLAFVIPPFALQLFMQHTHITLMF